MVVSRRLVAAILWLYGGTASLSATEPQIVSVRDYGAKGDNATDDTAAFVAAIAAIDDMNAAVDIAALQSRPTLLAPAGGAYLISPINLTSNMDFLIEAGASVVGAMDTSKYPLVPFLPSYGRGEDHPGPRYMSLIHGEHLQNVSISGRGTLDGQGFYWWDLNARGLENYT